MFAGSVEMMTSIATTIGTFVAGTGFDDIPVEIVERAKDLLLDSVGLAFAATTFDFSIKARAVASALGTGPSPIIGTAELFALRDAMLVNGIHVHGLDFDDTHGASVSHVSSSSVPLALGLAADRHASGRDLLTAYILAVEINSRLGAAANFGFHTHGFHPTGLVGTFGCAVGAAKLLGLDAAGIARAQGIAGSFASSNLEFLETGAWTKRIHPGWAAVSGYTAAIFAMHAYEAPPFVYEGRYGLYNTHLPPGASADLAACTKGLGDQWEVLQVAVKPFPLCHFNHTCADAALHLVTHEGLRADEVERIDALVSPAVFDSVCLPRENKIRPRSEYDAKFSLPFVVAASIVRGRFTLAELHDDALCDPEILALAERVTCVPDRASGHPIHLSGEVIVTRKDGSVVSHREQIHRGSGDRPMMRAELVDKYTANMALCTEPATDPAATDPATVDRVLNAVFSADSFDDAADLARILQGR